MRTLAERLLPRIAIPDIFDDFDVCWPWTGRRCNGYGSVSLGKRGLMAYAHRMMFELTWGKPVPPGMHVCHTCDNPICCRPSHLWLGTNADNHRDKIEKGRGNAPKGEQHPKAKLTVEQVFAIRASGRSHTDLAEEYGVEPPTIGSIRQGLHWKSVPGPTVSAEYLARDYHRDDHVKGEAVHTAKLTASQVLAIRASTASHRALAAQYGVSHAVIGYIRRRETWRHLP